MSNLVNQTASAAADMAIEKAINNPEVVRQMAENAGLPDSEDLQAMETARLQAEQGQDNAIQGLQEQISNIQLTPGPKGDKGDAGAVGPHGATGLKGDTGAQGATGAKGDKGDKGDAGIQGPKGDAGSTGATGPSGLLQVQRKKAQTNATGDYTWVFDTAFSVAPNIKCDIETTDSAPHNVKIVSCATTQAVFKVQKGAAVSIAVLGIGVLPYANAGVVTLHLSATPSS